MASRFVEANGNEILAWLRNSITLENERKTKGQESKGWADGGRPEIFEEEGGSESQTRGEGRGGHTGKNAAEGLIFEEALCASAGTGFKGREANASRPGRARLGRTGAQVGQCGAQARRKRHNAFEKICVGKEARSKKEKRLNNPAAGSFGAEPATTTFRFTPRKYCGIAAGRWRSGGRAGAWLSSGRRSGAWKFRQRPGESRW